MDIKTVTINLKNLMNKWFYTREQIHELLEDYVTVNNQGILSVGIPSPEKITLTTTNNAITTADVAEVTAKVTDNSNTPSYGVPVEFVNRATREVLHHDTTNSDGECVFEYFTEEAEILPLQARISNDYIFKDDGRLNSHNSWDRVADATLVRYDTYSCLQPSGSASPILYSLLLSGYTDITFKIKFYTLARMGLISCSSTGTDQANFKYFDASQLGLSADTWYTIQFSCLDDRIIIYCKETGNVKVEWIDSLPSYYKFYLTTSNSASIDFCDVKINRASDDLSMFIKDTGNLLTFNQWTCGDYNQNMTGFSSVAPEENIELNKNYTINGDTSIKLTGNNNNTVMIYAVYNISSEDIGKTLTLKAHCFKEGGNPSLQLLFYNQNSFLKGTETQVSSNTFEEYTLTYTIPSNTTLVHIRLRSVNTDTTYYVDNLHLIIQ